MPTYLLAGSVQHSADMLRIRAEVVRTDDGSALWTKQFDRPYGDLFALQDELTRSIARVLKARLLRGDGKLQSNRPPSGNLEAYGAYIAPICRQWADWTMLSRRSASRSSCAPNVARLGRNWRSSRSSAVMRRRHWTRRSANPEACGTTSQWRRRFRWVRIACLPMRH